MVTYNKIPGYILDFSCTASTLGPPLCLCYAPMKQRRQLSKRLEEAENHLYSETFSPFRRLNSRYFVIVASFTCILVFWCWQTAKIDFRPFSRMKGHAGHAVTFCVFIAKSPHERWENWLTEELNAILKKLYEGLGGLLRCFTKACCTGYKISTIFCGHMSILKFPRKTCAKIVQIAKVATSRVCNQGPVHSLALSQTHEQ